MTWWQQAASMDEVHKSTSSFRLISSPHLTNNTHTSTNTHTHVDTSLIHHGSSIYRDWPSSNTHNKRGWGVKFIFYYSSISLNTHHQHATHTTQQQHMCQHITHTWPQQHVGWVTPSSNTHNSTGDIFFQHAAPTPLFVAAWCYNLCCSSKHQHTHSNITIDDLHSSHNVFHNITVTQ